jgi:hypothetical protein
VDERHHRDELRNFSRCKLTISNQHNLRCIIGSFEWTSISARHEQDLEDEEMHAHSLHSSSIDCLLPACLDFFFFCFICYCREIRGDLCETERSNFYYLVQYGPVERKEVYVRPVDLSLDSGWDVTMFRMF